MLDPRHHGPAEVGKTGGATALTPGAPRKDTVQRAPEHSTHGRPEDKGDRRAYARLRRAVSAAMARGDYWLAAGWVSDLAHPMTPERVLFFAAGELRTNANAADPLLRYAMRIAEAVWLAVRRGDAAARDALRTPDLWARDYLEGQREDERFSTVRLLDKPDAYGVPSRGGGTHARHA